MGLVVGSEWRAALWRSCRAAQSPMRARGMSTCLGPYRGFWVLDSGAFHRQVCGQTGVTGRKADVQLAAWTARQAGRKRLPSGLLPRVWQPRRSPAAPLGRAQHPSVHSASTPPPPRLHPAATPPLPRGHVLQWRGGLGCPPVGCHPENGPGLPPGEWTGLCPRVQAAGVGRARRRPAHTSTQVQVHAVGYRLALLWLQAAECAVRMFKAGAKNHEITAMIAKACNHSRTTLQPRRRVHACNRVPVHVV